MQNFFFSPNALQGVKNFLNKKISQFYEKGYGEKCMIFYTFLFCLGRKGRKHIPFPSSFPVGEKRERGHYKLT